MNMTSNNSMNDIFSSINPLVPNIILDSIGIGLCIIAICQTFVFILLIVIHYEVFKLTQKIVFVLSLNMYINVFIFACFTLRMFISMIKGHMNPNDIERINNTLLCRLEIYFSTIALISALYSNSLIAFHRFLRIIYYARPLLYNNIYLFLFGILIQTLLSAFLQLPILLLGDYDYEDYHCQVYLTNWRGILRGASLVWLPPVLLTILMYTFTMRYIRRQTPNFTFRQRRRIQRDLIVIRRVLWLVIFIIIFGTPACSTTIVYHIFGYIGWWANHLTWITFISSFTGMSIVHTYYAPHIRILWLRTTDYISPTEAMKLNSR